MQPGVAPSAEAEADAATKEAAGTAERAAREEAEAESARPAEEKEEPNLHLACECRLAHRAVCDECGDGCAIAGGERRYSRPDGTGDTYDARPARLR